jgi:hypothetical protein
MIRVPLSNRSNILERHSREGMIGYLKEVIEDKQKDSRIANDASNQYQFAHYHAALGHIDKVLHWLEKAIAGHAFLAAFVRAEPMFDDLHADPRYQSLLAKMNLAS